VSERVRVACALALLLVLGAVAGCAGPDLAKVTFARTTVPAGGLQNGPPSETPKADDPIFSVDRLKQLDPCQIMDKEALASLGTVGGDNRLEDYQQCANYRIKDTAGKDIGVTLYLGRDYTGDVKDANKNLAGLATRIRSSTSQSCFVDMIIQRDPDRSITIQISHEGGDPCADGRKVAVSVVNKLREGTPKLPVEKGSLVATDPCTIVDDAAVGGVIGGSPKKAPKDLHQCKWTASTGASTYVSMQFMLGTDPTKGYSRSPIFVDLGGGVRASQTSETGYSGRCELEWATRPLSDNRAELVHVTYSRSPAQAGEDMCGKLVALAKAAAGKLPK